MNAGKWFEGEIMTTGEWCVVVALLIAACWTDLRTLRIPNGLTLSFMAGGIVYRFLAQGTNGLGMALAGTACGLLPLYLMHRMRGIGGGDVKWFGAFGAWAGPALAFQLLFHSLLFGGGIACALLAIRLPGLRKLAAKIRWPWGEHPLTGGRNVAFPFMLAVAPGMLILLGKG